MWELDLNVNGSVDREDLLELKMKFWRKKVN